MRKSINRKAQRITMISLLLIGISIGVIAIVHAGGLATRPVAKISGELAITDEGGVKQAVVVANVDYLQSTKEGTAHLAIRRDGVRIAAVNARIKADTQEQAAAAVSALILRLTNRGGQPGVHCSDINESGRGLQCSDIRFEGDQRIFAEQADKMIDWWDAHAKLTHPNYISPLPSSLGRLQFTVHGTDTTGGAINALVILTFDPVNPRNVVGGRVITSTSVPGPVGPTAFQDVVSGTLTTPANSLSPGEFELDFFTGQGGYIVYVAILDQPDGTFDLRGTAFSWPYFGTSGTFTVEGVGNTKFVMPGQ